MSEETGAIDFEIYPVSDYSARTDTVAADGQVDTVFAKGQVFFALVKQLGQLSKSENEICEVKLFNDLPEKMTYPHFLPMLYNKTQEWLNK